MLRKINTVWDKANKCLSPSHNPPTMMVLENGEYEWTCPTCGHKQYFVVNRPTW